MCGVTPASPMMPPPSTSGGGLTTPAPPIDAAALVPVLQQLVAALQALANALQGAGAVTAGGAAAGAMGAPTADAAAGAKTKGGGHAGHAPTKGGGGHGAHAGAGSHHGMRVVRRDKPVDATRAQANMSAVYSAFSRHTRQGLDFRNNQTHGYLSEQERAAFGRQHPGLPVPQSLVFREGSNVPIGAVYRSGAAASGDFDLGMGDRHVHNDHPDSQMQHLWFTPNHLEFAFSDVEHGMTGSTAAAMKRLGYPT